MNAFYSPANRGRLVRTAAGGTVVGRALLLLRQWTERRRQRRALARLDDALLRDVGLTCDEVRRETEKPFWRA
ncbi:MAG TPA: DUF1127 domain-containing protein [Azospirillum sp.]|nr:DUF1127 domain-containing protein [Azospirillum sp.]